MKQKDKLPILYGFKRFGSKSDYWFELKVGDHRFVTSDNHYKRHWIIGYENTKYMDGVFWFNDKLKFDAKTFGDVFKLLTGKDILNYMKIID